MHTIKAIVHENQSKYKRVPFVDDVDHRQIFDKARFAFFVFIFYFFSCEVEKQICKYGNVSEHSTGERTVRRAKYT